MPPSASSARRRNDKEKAALAARRRRSAMPALFVPTPAAACKAQTPKVVMPAFGAKPGEPNTMPTSTRTYEFRCANPAALKSVETTIFKSFKRLYRLEARRAGPGGQGARLTPKNPVLAW
jgi:hypothetical protein